MRRVNVVLAMLLLSVAAFAQNQDKEKAAQQEAKQWLWVVDSGHYAQSWLDAASNFKAAVAQDEWIKKLQGLRGPLGAMVSRNFLSAQYATQLPGVPDGEYVVLQFDTRFEHKKKSVETVTAMLEPDGNWKISGYYIK